MHHVIMGADTCLYSATGLLKPSTSCSNPQGRDVPADSHILLGMDCRLCNWQVQSSGLKVRQYLMDSKHALLFKNMGICSCCTTMLCLSCQEWQRGQA